MTPESTCGLVEACLPIPRGNIILRRFLLHCIVELAPIKTVLSSLNVFECRDRSAGMCKWTIALTLSWLIGSAVTHGAAAQGASPAITEAEAQSIAVDAYVYF